MKSSENPWPTCGVMVARSMPSIRKMPNSTSSRPVPSSSAQVGAAGCRAFIASPTAKWPAYILMLPCARDTVQPGDDGDWHGKAQQAEKAEFEAAHREKV